MSKSGKDTQSYVFEQLSPQALTVSISFLFSEHQRKVIDLRSKSRFNAFLSNKSQLGRMHILRLYEMGFDYIDVGFQADWIAAEIPLSANPTEASLHNAGQVLKDLKMLLSNG